MQPKLISAIHGIRRLSWLTKPTRPSL